MFCFESVFPTLMYKKQTFFNQTFLVNHRIQNCIIPTLCIIDHSRCLELLSLLWPHLALTCECPPFAANECLTNEANLTQCAMASTFEDDLEGGMQDYSFQHLPKGRRDRGLRGDCPIDAFVLNCDHVNTLSSFIVDTTTQRMSIKSNLRYQSRIETSRL